MQAHDQRLALAMMMMVMAMPMGIIMIIVYLSQLSAYVVCKLQVASEGRRTSSPN